MKRLPLVCCAAALAGCTLGPNYQRPETTIPPGYAEPHASAALGDTDLAAWWRGFGDPELDTLVESRHCAKPRRRECGGAHPRGPSPRRRRRRDRLATSLRRRFRHPSTDQRERLSRPARRRWWIGRQRFAAPGSEFTTWRAGFDASWEIDLFGKTRRSVEAARARTAAALWTRRDAQVSTAAEVANAYLALRTLQQRIIAAEAEVARQQRSERLVGARVRGGLVTGEDLEQQRSRARLGARRDSPAAGAGGGADPRARRADRRCARSADRRAVARRLAAAAPAAGAGWRCRPTFSAAGPTSASPSATSTPRRPTSALQPPTYTHAFR